MELYWQQFPPVIPNVKEIEQTDTVQSENTESKVTENHMKCNLLLQLELAENEPEVQRSQTDDTDAQRKRRLINKTNCDQKPK